jgi:hypothetical protein
MTVWQLIALLLFVKAFVAKYGIMVPIQSKSIHPTRINVHAGFSGRIFYAQNVLYPELV